MTKCTVPLFEPGSPVTFFNYLDRVEMLIRSADWYLLPPITRYLLNMAASDIRMADAKTETRVYTTERIKLLAGMLDRAPDSPVDVAYDAWLLWCDEDVEFGVVHLELEGDRKGELIIGDDPCDVNEFMPDHSDQAWDAEDFA